MTRIAARPRRSLPLACALLAPLLGCASPETREVRPLMGSECEIRAFDPDSARARSAIRAAFTELEELEFLLSTWKRGSEITRLNERAGQGFLRLDPRTFEILRLSKQMSRETEGAFDITVGPLVKVWRVDESRVVQHPPVADAFEAARTLVGWEWVVLNETDRSASLLRAGMEVDLGGIGLGYAVDRAVTVLREAGVPAASVGFPGHLRAYGKPPGGVSWQFPVRHPREEGRSLAIIPFAEGALSTSGDYVKRVTVRSESRSHTHILNPKTGKPVEGVASVTVLAPTAAEADALSTAAFVLGPRKGIDLLGSRSGVEGLLVGVDPGSPSRLRKPALTPGWAGTLKVSP